jgi:hypothetical protein
MKTNQSTPVYCIDTYRHCQFWCMTVATSVELRCLRSRPSAVLFHRATQIWWPRLVLVRHVRVHPLVFQYSELKGVHCKGNSSMNLSCDLSNSRLRICGATPPHFRLCFHGVLLCLRLVSKYWDQKQSCQTRDLQHKFAHDHMIFKTFLET